jgi:transcriptional regulator with XRE-family HTH domain
MHWDFQTLFLFQPMIRGSQIRAARALLGIGQQELSTLAHVGINTVKRLEQSTELAGSVRTRWQIQKALEAAGVEFIPADEAKGPGVNEPRAPRRRRK